MSEEKEPTEMDYDYPITEEDSNYGNLLDRAAYCAGLAGRSGMTADDRLFLLRASRSLSAFAAQLRKQKRTQRECGALRGESRCTLRDGHEGEHQSGAGGFKWSKWSGGE